MRQFARDHAIAHDVGVQIVAVGQVVDAAADVGPMPAAHVRQPIGGVAMVVELAANPDDRTGLGGERRCVAVALAILPRLEQGPLLGKERMLLDIRDADVVAFTGCSQHQLEGIAAGFDGAVDRVAGGLAQACLSLGLAFHDAVSSVQLASP